MITIASFYANFPNPIQLFSLTDKYLVVGTVYGLVNVVNVQCRHIASSDNCEHRIAIKADLAGDLDCYEDMLIIGNVDGKVRIWDACTG